jgi:hypothetical protein
MAAGEIKERRFAIAGSGRRKGGGAVGLPRIEWEGRDRCAMVLGSAIANTVAPCARRPLPSLHE